MKHVLEMPWGSEELVKKFELKTIKGGYQVYNGVLLPRELRPYKSENFSLAKWKEDEENAHVFIPEKPKNRTELNEQYVSLKDKTVNNYEKRTLLISEYHSDEERTAVLYGLSEISTMVENNDSKDLNKHKLLIVTTKSLIPIWRKLIESIPVVPNIMRPLIIDYNNMSKLLVLPPAARLSKKKSVKDRAIAKNGISTIEWDYIIYDNPYQIKNYPKNLLSNIPVNISKLESNTENKPYSIFMGVKWDKITDYALTSTIFDSTPSEWHRKLKKDGYKIMKKDEEFIWLGDLPKRGKNSKLLTPEQSKAIAYMDNKKFQEELKKMESYHETENKDIVIPYPITLSGKHRVSYMEIWEDFKNWLNKNPKGKDKAGYISQMKSYNRRINYIREKYITQLIIDLENNGNKVIISTENSEVRINSYREALYEKKIYASTTMNNRNLEELVEDYKYDVTNVTATENKEILESMLTEPILNIVETSMRKVYPLFVNNNGSTITYIPYMVDTIEEKILERTMKKQKPLTATEYENIYRNSAARRTIPNRLS